MSSVPQKAAAAVAATEFSVCECCGTAGQKLKICTQCKAVHYCGKDCQVQHWKTHKEFCKKIKLNSSGGSVQVNCPDHNLSGCHKSVYDIFARNPRFVHEAFDIFRSNNDSLANVAKMKKLLGKLSMWQLEMLLVQSMQIQMDMPVEMSLKETSPVKVLLAMGCDPNYLSRPPPPNPPDGQGQTPLHSLAQSGHASKYECLQVQTILAQQLLEAGANVNARAGLGLRAVTPLHCACYSGNVTNLGLIRLLLENGADTNAQTIPQGETPLMYTLMFSMSAAKLLLTYPNQHKPVNVNVQSATGSTFLGGIRDSLKKLPYRSDYGEKKKKFLEQQLRDVEQLLEEREAIDCGWILAGNPVRQRDGPRLDFDVGVLLNVDDLTKHGPRWYRDLPFWINDGKSIQMEIFTKQEHLHSGYKENGMFLDNNKQPAVGQKVQITVVLPHSEIPQSQFRFGILKGKVTAVGAMPTDTQLKKGGSFLYGNKCHCGEAHCSITRDGTRDSILRKFGCLHGQEVEARVKLEKQQDEMDDFYGAFFLGAGTKYDVCLRCNDDKQNQWQVKSIRKAAA